MKTAGLSIENGRLSVSIIERKLGITRLLKAQEHQLPTDEEGKTTALREILLKLKNDFGIKGVSIGLQFSEFGHHFIEIPLKKKSDIAGAIGFELEKHLPLPVEEYSYRFSTLSTDKEGSKNLVLSIRKDRLRWIFNAVQGSSLALFGIRCVFIEAIREFISSGKAHSAILLACGGDDKFYIAGIRDKVPLTLMTKTGGGLTKALEQISETYKAGIYAVGASSSYPEGINLTSLPYSYAHLVAISPFRGGRLNYDFAGETEAPASYGGLLEERHFGGVSAVLVASAVMLFILSDIGAYLREYSALKEVEQKTSEIRKTAGMYIEKNKETEADKEKIRYLLGFRAGSNAPVKALREMSQHLPQSAWLTDFSASAEGVLEVKGLATKAAEVIEPLQKSGAFKNVEFSAPITRKDNFQRFALKAERVPEKDRK